MFLTLMREAAEVAGLDPDDVRAFVEAHEQLVEAAEGVFSPGPTLPPSVLSEPRHYVRGRSAYADRYNELRNALETLDHFKDLPMSTDWRLTPR
jgi:hypothetical protein